MHSLNKQMVMLTMHNTNHSEGQLRLFTIHVARKGNNYQSGLC